MDIPWMNVTGANTTNTSSVTSSTAVVLGIRVGVGTASSLSLIGSALIIFTFVAYRDLRTTARQLLVNLSIADFLVASSHLVGLLENSKTFTAPQDDMRRPYWLCTAQAAFSVFGTESSILWTIAIAVYLFVVIVLLRPVWAKRLVPLFYVLCWGIPVILTIWLGVSGFLDFEFGGDPAFCGIRGTFVKNSTSGELEHLFYPIVVGYEMWNYLAFILLPILYIAIRCKVKIKFTNPEGKVSPHLQTTARTVDKKLIFIPLIYMLLRIWSVGVDIAIFYLPHEKRELYKQSVVSVVFVILVGVCDSAQGFVNSILFCVFTKAVRERLCGSLKKCFYRVTCRYRLHYDVIEPGHEDTTCLVNSMSENNTELLQSSSEGYGTQSPYTVSNANMSINI